MKMDHYGFNDGTTRYFLGGQPISGFEMNEIAHMAEMQTTLKAILKELKKLNKALTP